MGNLDQDIATTIEEKAWGISCLGYSDTSLGKSAYAGCDEKDLNSTRNRPLCIVDITG